MKKLVIFLILFIFSMPAFTQGESSFTENFSLIRDQGADNHGFLTRIFYVLTIISFSPRIEDTQDSIEHFKYLGFISP